MSEPENWQNERQSDRDPWIKIERRANQEKKNERPALMFHGKLKVSSNYTPENIFTPKGKIEAFRGAKKVSGPSKSQNFVPGP